MSSPDEPDLPPAPSAGQTARELQRRGWWPRLAILVLLVAAVALARRRDDVSDFRATGTAVDLPGPGDLPSVDRAMFEGMIVGAAGRPAIVNIWASWCAPCRTEMPLLDAAARAHGGEILMLGVATKDDPAAARRFLDDLGVVYPSVFDADGSIRVALGVSAFPTTYVFNRRGELKTRVVGGVSEQRLAALIQDALE